MGKKNLTIDERIASAKEAIENEETAIKARRERLKKLQSDLQALEAEKEKMFTDELLQIVSDSGIRTDEEKQELLRLVKKEAAQMKSKNENSAVGAVAETAKSAFSSLPENRAGETARTGAMENGGF